MNLHEYQGKQLFKEYGLPVSEGYAADTAQGAVEAADRIGGEEWVVKCQVHAGGRGKAGGVKLVKSGAEAAEVAKNLIGKNLVTYQTDENGQPCNLVYVTDGVDIERELYLAILLDRATSQPIVMASSEGGVEIEEVAKNTPEKIFREQIDPALGLSLIHI